MSTQPLFQPNFTKQEIKHQVSEWLEQHHLIIKEHDFNRPWGGFFVVDEESLPRFIDLFFPQFADLKKVKQKLSPKVLVVQPKARLSWQYHHRRAELWRVLAGPIEVMMSETDEQNDAKVFQTDEYVELKQGQRHRLIGHDNWGMVAEIWKHTDESNPSNEEDIVRVQDDYGR